MWRRLFVRARRCRHEWGGWWIDDETGIASRQCVWCPAVQLEQLAHHKPRRKPKR